MSSRRLSRRLDVIEPSWGFYLLGVGGFAFGIGHYATAGGGLGPFLEALVLWALSTVTVHTGYDLASRSLSRSGSFRAVGYTYLLVFSFLMLAAAIVLTWLLEHGRVQEGQFVLIFAGVLGAAVGGRSSLFVVELRESFERNQELTKLLTVNQRVLRHNLRNEVTIVLGYLEDLDDSSEVKLVRRHLDDLLETSQEAHRIAEIWEQDRQYEFAPSDLLAERAEAFRERFPEVDVTVDCGDAPEVSAHVALPMAIDELLENAVHHNDRGVAVTMTCAETDDGVSISVADTGRGIPADEAGALFQERETALEHGNGLGLWLVYWTAVKSDGELRFRENDPSGTVVELLLPEAR